MTDPALKFSDIGVKPKVVEEQKFKSRNIKSNPSYDEMIKLARKRGSGWRITRGKNKEELAEFLGIDLVYNPDWRPPSSPRRPDNDTLRLLADRNKPTPYDEWETVILDTNTNEEFRFRTNSRATKALGTESKNVLSRGDFSDLTEEILIKLRWSSTPKIFFLI